MSFISTSRKYLRTASRLLSILFKKNRPFVFFVGSVLLLEVALVMLQGGGFNWMRGFLHTTTVKTPPGILLFESDQCSSCAKVEDFIKNNKVEGKVQFTRLDILNSTANMNILSDKAQICGLAPSELGVPFLWDGAHCILGYIDVIQFFRTEIARAAKKPK
jgi:glutaredoxin-related protein